MDIKFLEARYEPITESGCWIWTGAIDVYGYGQLGTKKKSYKAHREVYKLLIGDIPDGLVIHHLCRVRCCVNPAHLRTVTIAENVLCGIGPTAINARKTHCNRGHELTPINLMKWKMNGRFCKECYKEDAPKRRIYLREYMRKWRKNKKENL